MYFLCFVDITAITCVCFSGLTKGEWKTDTKKEKKKKKYRNLVFIFTLIMVLVFQPPPTFWFHGSVLYKPKGSFTWAASVCKIVSQSWQNFMPPIQAGFEVLAHFPVLITRKQYNCIHMCTIPFGYCLWAVIMCWHLQPWFLHSHWVSTQLEVSKLVFYTQSRKSQKQDCVQQKGVSVSFTKEIH